MSPPQRPQGKCQCRQKSVNKAEAEFCRIDICRKLNRQNVGQSCCGGEWDQRADYQPDADPDQGDHQHLDEIDAENEVARCAEAFKAGDHFPLGFQISADCVCNTHAANHQRGQTHQGEKLGKAPDAALKAGRRIGP